MAETTVNTIPTNSNTDITYRAFSEKMVTVGDLYESLTRVYEIYNGLKVFEERLHSISTIEDAGSFRVIFLALDGMIKEIDPIYPIYSEVRS